jgi:uncharacterized protein YegP (UPF0339 family)
MFFYVYRDAVREWRWRLYANNTRKIANSGEGYKNRQDCLHAIYLIKGGAGGAPIKYEQA